MDRDENALPLNELLVGAPIIASRSSAKAAAKTQDSAGGLSNQRVRPGIRRAVILVLLCVIPLIHSAPAPAQDKTPAPDLLDKSLEDLMSIEIDSVYSASGFKQKITEAPASVTIVTSDEIQRYGYRTLSDILRNVPGFYVSYDRNYSYVGVIGDGLPGQYNNGITLLIDGHRLNDDVYDGNLLGTDFPIDVDLIDRVEVIRGPNSSLYVASAFLGVVNVITKRGRDLQKVSVAGEAASYGTYQGRVSYGDKFDDGLEVLLSSSFYDSHGQDQLFFPAFDNPSNNNGIAVNADGDEFHQLFGNASWGGFTLHGVFGSRDKGIPTAPFGSDFDVTGTHTIDVRGYLDLQYDRELGHGWNVSNRIYYDLYNNDGTYVYDDSSSGGPSRVLNENFAHGKWWGDEVTFSKQVFERQRLTLGSEFRDNFEQNQGNYDLQPFVQYFSSRRSSTVFSVYAQDEVRLRKNLILNLGLRYDRYSTFGGTTNPRAALIYNPWTKTTFKFLYGQSFRAPNTFELYYDAPGNEANPSLRPETLKTTELVWDQSFANHFRMIASGFYYPIHSVISEQVDPANGNGVFTNAGSLDLRGLEVSLLKSFPGGLEGSVSYTFQDAVSPNAQVPVTNSPKHLIQAGISVPVVRQKVFASMNLQYLSRRETLAGQYSAAYAVPNFTFFSRNVLKGWEVSASIYNPFNEKYADPSGDGLSEDVISQDGRNFRIKVGHVF
jgi:outer membrane receptor for ferrienterochelin and colicins